MKAIETANLLAVCGHKQSGSSVVFAKGKGVSRVNKDTAGGLISGPGSSTVFVEGFKASIVGDIVASHAPCPLPPTHCASPVNLIGQPLVIVGE